MLIDTHCHLDAPELGEQDDLAAQTAGVELIVVPSIERANFATVQSLCEKHPACSPAYGIHPLFVAGATDQDLAILRDYLHEQHPVAVGEIGLDFFIPDDNPARQEYFFIEQLKLAREFDLPVLLHLRRAHDIALKQLRRIKVRGGIAHAYSGSRSQANVFIKLGFKLGFGGAMTYPRATRLRELAATLPLESIVLETDAPDMPPEFIERGQPNKPEYLPRIASTLAQLRGISLVAVREATSQNALTVLTRLHIQKNS
ncbi:MAG: TatD family hydrolase [Gallionella sp.]